MKFSFSPKILGWVMAAGILSFCSGCGGGGGGGGSSAPSAPPPSDANLAPVALTGLTVTFQDPDIGSLRSTYTFTAANYTSPSGDAGSYYYVRASTVNQASLVLNTSFATVLRYQMFFTSHANGTYIDNDTGKTSTFTSN